jgi:hypothetical protein
MAENTKARDGRVGAENGLMLNAGRSGLARGDKATPQEQGTVPKHSGKGTKKLMTAAALSIVMGLSACGGGGGNGNTGTNTTPTPTTTTVHEAYVVTTPSSGQSYASVITDNGFKTTVQPQEGNIVSAVSNPNGSVYLGQKGTAASGNAVMVINPSTNAVTSTIQMDTPPSFMVANPSYTTLIAGSANSSATNVDAISLQQNNVVANVGLAMYTGAPSAIVAGGNSIYFVWPKGSFVGLEGLSLGNFEITDAKVYATSASGSNAAFSPNGQFAALGTMASVTFIGSDNFGLISTIPLPSSAPVAPVALQYSPDSSKLYALYSSPATSASLGKGYLAVIDSEGMSISNNVQVGSAPLAMALSTDGSSVYVLGVQGSPGSMTLVLSQINTSTNAVGSTVNLQSLQGASAPTSGYSIMQSPDGEEVFVAGGNSVYMIDASTMSLRTTANLGGTAGQMATEDVTTTSQ